MTDIKRACFHEAGHAACAHALGYEVVEIRLLRLAQDDWGGVHGWNGNATLFHIAQVAFAGPEAECVFLEGEGWTQEAIDAIYTDGWRQDLETVDKTGLDIPARLQASGATQELIEKHWALVQAVAAALEPRETIDRKLFLYIAALVAGEPTP